ncbi:UDP-glucuronic acid decarboxylase family protein [Nocardioides sp. P5_C9_2]
MTQPRVVVTGGAGFLGSHLCERLLAEEHRVTCVDSFLTGRPENVAHLAEHPGFDLVEADVTEGLPVTGRVDVVLHLASPASPADYLRLPVETLHVGAVGTLHALTLAREHAARFLVASSSEVYGDPRVHPQPESYWGHANPVGPRSVYDEAKRFAESLTTAFRTTHGVDTAIVRLFNTFGPRLRVDDGRAVPTFIRQALRGEPLTVTGDGSQTRSLCYVDDAVEGLLRLVRSGHPGPMNLGNPREMSVLDLALLVRDLAGSTSEIAFVPRPVDDPTVRRPDIALAGRELGWRPVVPLEEALMRTIRWYRDRPEVAASPSGAPARARRSRPPATPLPRARPGHGTVPPASASAARRPAAGTGHAAPAVRS